MGLAKRLSEAMAAGRAAVRAAEGPPAPKPPRGRVALLALDETPEAVLAAVQALQAGGEPAVVLVTDLRLVELYQIAGVVTEHLSPDLGRGPAAGRRLSHLLGKWAVRRCDALGEAAAQLAREAQANRAGVDVNLLASTH